jgi:hypothetical protein
MRGLMLLLLILTDEALVLPAQNMKVETLNAVEFLFEKKVCYN